MVAVDTNILIRLLVDDLGAIDQVKIARETVRAADQVYIPQIVQVECIWVLQRVYEFDKANIIAPEVEEVLRRAGEDRPGREGSRVAIGRTSGGRYLRVIYVPDPEPDSVFVITAYELRGKSLTAYRRRRRRKGK